MTEKITKIQVNNPGYWTLEDLKPFICDGVFDMEAYEMCYPGKLHLAMMKIQIINRIFPIDGDNFQSIFVHDGDMILVENEDD